MNVFVQVPYNPAFPDMSSLLNFGVFLIFISANIRHVLIKWGVNTDMSVLKGMALINFLNVRNLSNISDIDFPEIYEKEIGEIS